MYQKIVSVPTTGITVEYDELFEAVTLEVLGTGEITAQYLHPSGFGTGCAAARQRTG